MRVPHTNGENAQPVALIVILSGFLTECEDTSSTRWEDLCRSSREMHMMHRRSTIRRENHGSNLNALESMFVSFLGLMAYHGQPQPLASSERKTSKHLCQIPNCFCSYRKGQSLNRSQTVATDYPPLYRPKTSFHLISFTLFTAAEPGVP